MAISQNWDKTRLQDYLLFDYWQPFQAWCLLSGLECEKNISLFLDFDLELTDDEEVEIYKKQLANKVDRLREFWLSGNENDDYHSPAYFIQWSMSKRIRPEWLDWAVEKKLFKTGEENLNQSEIENKSLSVRAENNYLRLIMQLANNIEGFNPKNPHAAAKLILSSIDSELSEKTIASYIQRAYELESKERD